MVKGIKSGRPVGTRFPAPQNPERVRRILDLREKEGLSFEKIGSQIGISRVAVRLQYLRWCDDPWAKGQLPGPDSRLPSVISPSTHT